MVSPEAARQQIRQRLDHLRVTSYDALSLLPPAVVEPVRYGTAEWSLTTYVEREKRGSVRVVVQIGPPQLPFLLQRVQADGFRITPDGAISPLAEKELLEFT